MVRLWELWDRTAAVGYPAALPVPGLEVLAFEEARFQGAQNIGNTSIDQPQNSPTGILNARNIF